MGATMVDAWGNLCIMTFWDTFKICNSEQFPFFASLANSLESELGQKFFNQINDKEGTSLPLFYCWYFILRSLLQELRKGIFILVIAIHVLQKILKWLGENGTRTMIGTGLDLSMTQEKTTFYKILIDNFSKFLLSGSS